MVATRGQTTAARGLIGLC